jgi:glycosyltransferase involved in cell wall biosynthesis
MGHFTLTAQQNASQVISESKPLRILIYASHFYPSVGGMQIVSETLARQFQRLGHKVVVATDTPIQGAERLSIPVYRKPSFWKFLRLCRESDILLLSPLTLRRIAVPLLSGRPIAIKHPNPLTGHRGETRMVDRLKLLICRRVVNIVAGQYMAGFFPNPVIIPNPYDNLLFRDNAEPKTRDVLFVGRLDSVKGADVLLQAVKKLEATLPALRLTIVGKGPEQSNLTELASRLGLEDRVAFTGEMTGDSLAQEMRRHSVMVVPSSYKEPFGNVALQGMASGCTMIVSKHGGLIDATGPHALTFENGDYHSLASCLEAAFCTEIRGQLIAGADEHLKRHHEDVVAKNYLNLLEAVVRKTHR